MVDKNFEYQTGLSFTLNVPIKSGIWQSTNIAEGRIEQVKDATAVINGAKPYFYVYSNNQFTIPEYFTFLISGWAYTTRYQGVFKQNALFGVDFGLSKTFFKKLNATVNYYNLLARMYSTQDFTINNISSKGVFYSDAREFSITLSYSFGAIKNSTYKNKQVDNNINRMQ